MSGIHTITAKKDGYKSLSKSQNLKYQGKYTVDFALEPIRVNSSPQTGTVTPNQGDFGISKPLIFKTTYSDKNGYKDIKSAEFLINTTATGKNGIYLRYDQSANKLYLRNETNTTWKGGHTPGSSNVIENSYVKLACQDTKVSGSGNDLTIDWQITFKPAFYGTKNIYLSAADISNANSGWNKKGSILIDKTAPQGTIRINNGAQYTNTPQVTLTLSAKDNPGGSGVSQMQLSCDGTNWQALEPYVITKNWTLASGEGTKSVYVKFKDVAGNWSTSVSDTIVLDTTPPAPPTIDSITSPTNITSQTITGTKSADTTAVILTCATASVGTLSYPLVASWECEITNLSLGANTITLTARDAAGNESIPVVRVIDYDLLEFVEAFADRLVLRESRKNFYFSSTNQYYLFYKPVAMVDEVFNDAKALGINVIRTWGFCDGMYKEEVSFQPEPGVYSETGFARMDYIIKKARDSGIRLIIPFVNYWNDFGGMDQYVSWSPTVQMKDEFYADEYCRELYKDYVEYFLNRENSLTGIRYKDDPTILIWELANEPRCSWSSRDAFQAWIEEMSAFIKSIDSNHLVSTGQEGWYKKSYRGDDYIGNNQSQDIDICSFHLLFDNWWNLTEEEALEWIDKHIDDAHLIIGKPVYCGEIGVKVYRYSADASEQMQMRNRLYEEWYAEFSDRVIDGGGFWLLSADSYPDYDGYTVYYPQDSQTRSIISNYSQRMAEMRNLGYFPPVFSVEDIQGNDEESLEYQIPVSNPSNLNISFSAVNLPEGAQIDSNGYLTWPAPEAGVYTDIEVKISFDNSIISDEINLIIDDVNGDNTPQIEDVPTIIMDKNTTLDNAVDLWAITTDDETPVEELVFTLTVSNLSTPKVEITLDSNRYIDITSVDDSVGKSYFTITATDQRGLFVMKTIYCVVKNNALIRVPADYATIKEAVSNASYGDTILVGPGTYYGGIRPTYIAAVSLISEQGPEKTIIDAKGDEHGISFDYRGDGMLVKGFTIKNAKRRGIYHSGSVFEIEINDNIIENNGEGGIWAGKAKILNNIIKNNRRDPVSYESGVLHVGDSCRISNNIVEDNEGTGIVVYGSWDYTALSVIIEDNIIRNNGGSGIYASVYSPTTTVPPLNYKIINNIIESNNSRGIYGYGILCGSIEILNNIIRDNRGELMSYGSGIEFDKVDSGKIINNVIVNNSGSADICIFYSPDTLVSNNIVVGGIRVSSSLTYPTFSYNNVWNNSPTSYSWNTYDESNISEDPQFVDLEGGDYHLQPTSPCINTGNPNSEYNDKDGSRNDMGIYGGPDSFYIK